MTVDIQQIIDLLPVHEPEAVALASADLGALVAWKTAPAEAYEALRAGAEVYNGPMTVGLEWTLCHLLQSKRLALGGGVSALPGVVAERQWVEERFGECAATLLFKGAEQLISGNRPAAMQFYGMAAERAVDMGLSRMFLGAFTTRTTGIVESGAPAPKLTWRRLPKKRRWWQRKPSCAVVVSADTRYFERFAAFFHENVRKLDKECHIHFHVVRWTKECADLMNKIADDRLSVSSEEWRYKTDYTYFACARFARAGEIMSKLGLPLYITDIDNHFVKPASNAAKELTGFDVGFRYHADAGWFPWWSPAGGNVWINNNARGRQAAKWLRAVIAERHIPNRVQRSWWLDQNALNEVRHHALERGFAVANLADGKFYASARRPESETNALKSKSWAPAS